MDSLVIRPQSVAHVRIAEDALVAVPVCDPHVVRTGSGRRERLQVARGRGGAAVDACDVTARMQLCDPRRDERLNGQGARCVLDGVGLQVEADRAAARQSEGGRLRDGVVRGCGSGAGGVHGREARTLRIRDARRL